MDGIVKDDNLASEKSSSVLTITTENISKLTTYELRQELLRRGQFDFKDENLVNYKSLLKRLMVEVVKDEQNALAAKEEARLSSIQAEKLEAKRLREARKAEAIARSQARQAEKGADYFANKARLNDEAKIALAVKKADSINGPEGVEVVGENDEVSSLLVVIVYVRS